jgi:transposase InsO family protein
VGLKTLKYEEVYRTECRHLTDPRSRLGEFLEQVYNEGRLHSALGDLSPAHPAKPL